MIDIYKSAMGVVAKLQECVGFQWDDGNAGKSLEKHGVHDGECEEIFFNHPLIVGEDEEHSEDEPRGLALGQTNGGRYLFLVFTVRNQLVRVISAT
jgi:uncharacterized protein